jgi:trehalose-6-phosphatase
VADDEEQIAHYLATRGATKCPTACAAETTGRVEESDRLAVAWHHDRAAQTMQADFVDKLKEKHRRRLEQLRRGLERLRRA